MKATMIINMEFNDIDASERDVEETLLGLQKKVRHYLLGLDTPALIMSEDDLNITHQIKTPGDE